MSFSDAVRTVYGKYATFDGRATRSEYWWFQLFLLLVFAALLFASIFAAAATRSPVVFGLFFIAFAVFALATFIPTLAVSVRRLHDTDKSGWWYLITLVPYVGGLILLIFMVLPSTMGANRYGPQAGVPDMHLMSYSGATRDEALARFAADRTQAAAYGYYPVSQTWRQGPNVEILDVTYTRHFAGHSPWGMTPPPNWG